MIIFFAVRGGFNIVYDTDGGSEVAARKVRYGEFLTEPETPYKPGYTFDGWYTEKEGGNSRLFPPLFDTVLPFSACTGR